MIKLKKIFIFSLLAAFPVSIVFGEGGGWSYRGKTGPAHWGDLKAEYGACKSGHSQSPIDLRWKPPRKGGDLEFDYENSSFEIVDNGHTIQVDFDNDDNEVEIRGHKYELLQFHFHSLSEHTLSARHYPIEMHLVHKDGDGKLAVIGVMFVEGKENPEIAKIWSNLPQEKNKPLEVEGVKLNPRDIVPQILTHYHYSGSLTTPPCSEGVNWNVLNTPLEMSRAQIEAFRKVYAGTNRPVQKLHGRKPANY